MGKLNNMKLFKKDRKPRIVFVENRAGIKTYYVETYKCYESGCMYSQESLETKDLEKAQEWLEIITNNEIIKFGVLD